MRLRALVTARIWTELEEIAKARKSPIGWEPYYNEILAAGNGKLAGSFVAKCANRSAKERAEMWVKCGMVARAGEELFKSKDLQGLEGLRGMVGSDRNTAIELERWIMQLKPKR